MPGGVDKSCTPWAFSVVQQVGCCLSPPQSETRSEMTINMEYKYLPNHCEHKKAHSNQAHNSFDLNIGSQTKNLVVVDNLLKLPFVERAKATMADFCLLRVWWIWPKHKSLAAFQWLHNISETRRNRLSVAPCALHVFKRCSKLDTNHSNPFVHV